MDSEPPRGRCYRVDRADKILAIVGSLVCLGIIATVVLETSAPNGERNAFALLGAAVFAAYSVFFTARAFMTTVSFTSDCIEVAGMFRIRSLPLAAIRGRREYMHYESKTRTRYSVLVSSDDRYPAVEYPKDGFAFDDAYWNWYDGLTDLDELDRRQNKPSSTARVIEELTREVSCTQSPRSP
ncbi:MAG TPA: hypothetical protein VMD29_03985 [Terracidiphilus sp.]|nr:hypothetical protein [Terracidiphilus sp.]